MQIPKINTQVTMMNNRQKTNSQPNFGKITSRFAREAVTKVFKAQESLGIGVEQAGFVKVLKEARGLEKTLDYNPKTKMITIDGEPADANKHIGLNLFGRLSEAVKEAQGLIRVHYSL